MKEIAFWFSVGLRCKCRHNIMSNLHIPGQLYKCVTVVVLWLATGRTEALQLLQETAVCTRVQSVQQDTWHRHSWGLLSNEPSYCIAQINCKNAFIAKGYVSQLIVWIFERKQWPLCIASIGGSGPPISGLNPLRIILMMSIKHASILHVMFLSMWLVWNIKSVHFQYRNVQMTFGGPGCRLQTCRRWEAQWFDSTFWA